MKIKSMSAVLAMLIMLTGTVFAAQDTVRIFLWDNDAGETTQRAPSAVMDENYTSRYVWADSRDGNFNIYGRIWGRKPAAATSAFLVNRVRVDEHTQEQPDVAGTVGDFFFVVWQDSVMKSGELWQLYGRKLDKEGKPLTDEMKLLEVANKGNAKYPKIAVNKRTQDIVVVWQDDRDGQIDVWGRLYNYKFEPLSGDIKINEDGLKVPHILPAVSFTDEGIAVTWQDYRDGASRVDIYMRYFKPDLSPLTASKPVNSDVESRHYTPSIAASDSGYFTIVWLSFQSNAYGDVYAQRYYPDAKALDQNFKINASVSPVACRIPSVVMGIDKYSFWTSWADSSSSTYGYQIRARYFDQYARLGSTVKIVNDNWTNGQRAPDVCRFGDWFSVAWLDSSRTNGRGDDFGQYYLLNSEKDDTLDAVGINYNITADKAAGRNIWYHPKKDYDNPATSGWNEDPIAEPESIYVPLDSAYVMAFNERNIPNQMFFQITDTDTLEYMWRKQGKLNSIEYDMCLLDLGYAEDGSSAGTIEPEQLDTLEDFAVDTSTCMMVTGNDFGEMYNATTFFSYFGSKYVGPGNSSTTGNIQKIEGVAGTFCEGMSFNYPYQQAPDNSVDIIDQSASTSQLIMGSDPAGKWSWGRATSYGDMYKGAKISLHKNVYLTFSIGSLTNGTYPSTASELTRRILAYQGYNVEPEPITDLRDSAYSYEGAVRLVWTAVSDDNLTEAATKYWMKYSKYNAAASDLGKLSSEVDFIDTGATYYQTWTPSAPASTQYQILYGLPPTDTLIFALKAGDESSPTRWGTLGNEPRIVVYGDTVTPHTIRLGYTYGCVNDFCKSERTDIRNSDTLYTTWDASNLYLGYGGCNWGSSGDLFIYFDTRTGGADSTCTYNSGDSCSGFDPAFRPDFCLIIENGTTAVLKKATGSKTWVDSIASYSTSYLSLDSINKYNYLEVRVPFSYLTYTVGNVFKYLVVCNYETSEHSWNAFPTTNGLGKGEKAPVAKYPYFYQINSLASNVSPRNADQVLAVELSEFTCLAGTDGITLDWTTSSENGNYGWIIQRSEQQDQNYRTLDTLVSEGGSPSGRAYSYLDQGVLPNRTYYYRLGDLDVDGQVTWHGPATAVSLGKVVEKVSLLPARPNPSSGATVIAYEIPKAGQVNLDVYDICGRRVKTLQNSYQPSGSYALTWKGDDQNGRLLPAGVYFYRLSAESASLTQKVVIVR
jgi:hypothetical protein